MRTDCTCAICQRTCHFKTTSYGILVAYGRHGRRNKHRVYERERERERGPPNIAKATSFGTCFANTELLPEVQDQKTSETV